MLLTTKTPLVPLLIVQFSRVSKACSSMFSLLSNGVIIAENTPRSISIAPSLSLRFNTPLPREMVYCLHFYRKREA